MQATFARIQGERKVMLGCVPVVSCHFGKGVVGSSQEVERGLALEPSPGGSIELAPLHSCCGSKWAPTEQQSPAACDVLVMVGTCRRRCGWWELVG